MNREISLLPVSGEAVHFFSLPVSRHDQVEGLAPGAKVLTASGFCPMGMEQVDNHMLSFQVHP